MSKLDLPTIRISESRASTRWEDKELVEVTAGARDHRRDQPQALVNAAGRHADVGPIAARRFQLVRGCRTGRPHWGYG
ncbi:hypothetical protein [Streptomyces sp. SPB074]|uniref:hypothetical protein n=1 Tax=Streptomyces sp. (strain SPB074) TaxID=465543 RepID=UPI001319D779|nr:hypothetical protein [Streptomyces sp. SPB074]